MCKVYYMYKCMCVGLHVGQMDRHRYSNHRTGKVVVMFPQRDVKCLHCNSLLNESS